MAYDTPRRAIWHFQIIAKEGTPSIDSPGLEPSVEVRGHVLVRAEEGTLQPSSLQKSRTQAHPTTNTPTSSSSSGSAVDQSQRNALATASQGPAANTQDQESKGAAASGTDPKGAQTPHKVVYENFITAVLLTVLTTLCARSGALPLNYRTVLLAPNPSRSDASSDESMEHDPVLGTFRAYLTTAGALVISLSVSQCRGLLALEDVLTSNLTLPGQQILAAPFGVMASHQSTMSGDGGSISLAQTPNTQSLSLRAMPDVSDSWWKQACLKVLELRGVSTSNLRHCSWVNLLVSKRQLQGTKNDVKRPLSSNLSASIPWPGPLCFRKKAAEVSATSRVGANILSGHEESHDALGGAGSWFNAAGEREEKIAKREADRASAMSMETNGSDPRTQKPNGQSPLAFRRPSTAAGNMYPTPPDGIQHLNGVTPSFDGTLSSPGNPPSAAAAVDMDSAMTSAGPLTDTFDETEFTDPKRDRSDSNLLGDPDNMFEDIGGDMFGDNDITEDDFSFFDQPDNVDMGLSMEDFGAPTEVPRPRPVPKTEEEPPTATNEATPRPAPDLDEIVFAKPEIQHARSSQNVDAVTRTQSGQRNSTKRERSPFDPDSVFKRVCGSSTAASGISNLSGLSSDRKTKIFEKVDFDSTLPMINKKYEQGGLFDYGLPSNVDLPKLEPGALPETEYLKRHGRLRRKPKPLPMGSLLKFTGMEAPTSHPSPVKLDGLLSEGDESSAESDQDDSSYTTEEPLSPLKSSTKPTIVDDDALSQVTSMRDLEPFEEPDQHFALDLPRLSKPDSPEVPLSKFFSDPEPVPLDLSLTDEDVVQIAQILTEQAATGSLEICNVQKDAAAASLAKRKRQSLAADARKTMTHLRDALGGTAQTHLKALLDVQDVPLLGQPDRRLQPRPIPGRDPNPEQLRANNLYQIPGPHLEVRRSEMKLSVLPSAVTFWESLGLAPSSGGKDVTGLCVFPGWKGMADNVNTFLGRMKSIYELLKLGTFDKMPLSGELEDGVLPYEVDRITTSPDATMTGHGSTLVESMETLRGAMSSLTTTATNVVVYFVYSPTNPGTVVEACTAFQRFFESYQKMLASKQETAQNELVLQLVSADFLSSSSTLVITPPADLIKLCMETYDRCTLFNGPMPAPAIRLERPLPRIIEFKLTNTPSASLVHENSCIHVAYAMSVDERWVTAAWTDDRGNQQATASYCLGRRGKSSSTSMNEVAHEIWESTLEIISTWKVQWRIIITKCAPMDLKEIDFWVDLARTESKANVMMVLMTVDTNPSLQLIPPAVKVPPVPISFYTTPVSTPQPSIVSPEQSATPATPLHTAATPGADAAAEAEADSLLIDVTDQTWGAVIGHRLSNSTTILDVHPALVSGYLIKRTGTRMEDPPVLMEVNLVRTDAGPRAYEPLLREMMSYFRGLGTLARARGVVEREADVRPWHVAAAEKAVRALYLLM